MGIRSALQSVVVGVSLGIAGAANALSPDTLQSVVSVIPEWPGQAQGGRGAPPGVAPEGSGVAISPGIVATAWHVVQPAERIEIRLSDGRLVGADLISADPVTDIALLSIEADVPPATFVMDYSLADPVCAVGNAFGLGLSITCGVISAVGVSNAGFNPVEDFVQTDAAVNPGMSGGALLDANGHLVGMVSAIFGSEGDGSIGVNFAVSSALLRRVSDALAAEGEVRFPEPGWRLGLPDRETRARLAAPVVLDVIEETAAARAGVKAGDLIIDVAGRRVRMPRDVVAALALVPPDQDYAIGIEREGTRQALQVAFGEPGGTAPDSRRVASEDCPHPQDVCRMRQAVFPVSSFDPVGSATRIGPDLLVTNRHVVGDRRDAVVHTPGGPREARVVPSAYLGDLVLLTTDGLPDAGYLPELEKISVAKGDLFAVGADIARQEVRVFEPGDLIALPAESADLGRLHVTSRMQPGVSGGALVDSDGNLVGIAVGGGDNRFEAIPVGDVLRLLDARDDPAAEDVTRRMGEAFASCERVLDGARNGGVDDGSLAPIEDECATAENQGQLLEAGRLLATAGAFDAAASLHAAAVDQVPNSINARTSLLVSLQLGARFEEMTAHARRLMEMAPDDPQALRFAIQSGVWGGDPDLAEDGYEALRKADPVQAQAARRFIDAAPPAPPRR